MVASHAGTLTLVSHSVEAGGGALFLLAIGLDYVDGPEGREGSFHEVVEPSLGYLPATFAGDPSREDASVVLQPGPVRLRVGEAQSQQLALARPAKNHRDFPLVPDFCELLRVHPLLRLPDPIDPVSAAES